VSPTSLNRIVCTVIFTVVFKLCTFLEENHKKLQKPRRIPMYEEIFELINKGDKVVKFYKHTNNNDWGRKNRENLLEKASSEYIYLFYIRII